MQAVQKFCGKAKIYAEHRPGYPKRYFCYLKRAVVSHPTLLLRTSDPEPVFSPVIFFKWDIGFSELNPITKCAPNQSGF